MMGNGFKQAAVMSLAATLGLSACNAIGLSNFTPHPSSGKKGKQDVIVQVLGPNYQNVSPVLDTTGLPQAIIDECTKFDAALVAPFVIPLVVGAATIALNALEAKAISEAEAMIKLFKYDYKTSINLSQFDLGNESKCIRIIRKLDDGKTIASDAVIHLQPVNATLPDGIPPVFFLNPIYLSTPFAGALTSKEAASIDVNLSVTIAALDQSNGRAQISPIASHVFSFLNASIGSTDTGLGLSPKQFGYASGIFLAPRISRGPATISVSVTEVGDGADSFGTFRDAIAANGNTINSALTGALEARLGQ